MKGRDWRLFGRLHAKLYKRLGGRFVGSLGLGRKVLLLTTTGRKSGLERTTPLVYMPHGNDAIIYPSNGGKETPPAWWLNLQANAIATIQIGKTIREVRARRNLAQSRRLQPALASIRRVSSPRNPPRHSRGGRCLGWHGSGASPGRFLLQGARRRFSRAFGRGI
jgi:deazaflavin-dependent oxidoreductase (nitroreductase family)